MSNSTLQFARIAIAVSGALALQAANAAAVCDICISTPFANLENDGYNNAGLSSGQFLRIGANSVTSSLGLPVTGTWTTPVLPNYTGTMSLSSSPLLPNFYSRYIAQSTLATYPGLLTTTYTMKFTDGTNTASQLVSLAPGATYLPFVNSITLSGTSLNPSFSWTPPPGTTPGVNVNGYRVNIYDKTIMTPGNSGQVFSNSFAYTQTTFNVGFAFNLAHQYVIEITALQTADGSNTNFSNTNLKSVSRVYADFTPKADGTPAVNLPVVMENGSYKFNISVNPGQTYYIDPAVAVGYVYRIGDGGSNFTSVLLPTGVGDGRYDILGLDSNGNFVLLAHDWLGGSIFNFAPGGVSAFEVLGIEVSAGLDPRNTTAFVTGLTFAAGGDGLFTGTMTPITVDVPEPASLALLLSAAAGLGLARRRRRQVQ